MAGMLREQLAMLWEMQLLERERQNLMTELEVVNTEPLRQLWSEVRLLEQGIVAEREKLLCLEKVCARKEKDLGSLAKHYQDMEQRLYSGTVQNSKELEQMTRKCESIRGELNLWEQDVMESMEFCEKLEQQIAREEHELEAKRRQHAVVQQETKARMGVIEEELSHVKEQCRQLHARLTPELWQTYQDLSRRLLLPVAKVENGTCNGCHRSLPICQQGSGGNELIFCDNCGRLLLVE